MMSAASAGLTLNVGLVLGIAKAGLPISPSRGMTALNPRFDDESLRSRNRVPINAAIAEKLRRRGSKEWVELLNKAGVPCGPVYRIDETFADPQVRHLGMARPVHHPTLGEIALVAQPITLERTPSRMATAAPERGEHTGPCYMGSATTTGRSPGCAATALSEPMPFSRLRTRRSSWTPERSV